MRVTAGPARAQYVGRFFGRALFDGQIVDAHFAAPLYKVCIGARARVNGVA